MTSAELMASYKMPTTIRPAMPSDIPALEQLIAVSARALRRGYYSPRQIEAAIR
jgi:hypothetical protein